MGDEYTIADIATLGWVDNMIGFYEARELVEFDRFGNVAAWLERGLARLAVRRGLEIPSRGWPLARSRYCSCGAASAAGIAARSVEHTSDLRSLMRNSYAILCMKTTMSEQLLHSN